MQNKLPSSAKILFISDAHLGGFSAEKNAQIEMELIELIEYAKNNEFQIAILGDLFDYWMEYKNFTPDLGSHLLDRFAAFNTSHSTLYITGNHDNWTRGYFSKMGFNVEKNYRLVTIGQKKVLLLHGDAIGEDLENLKRPLLHRLMRNKWFVKLYQTYFFRPKKGIQAMKYYSRFTNFLAGKPNPSPLNKWSKKILEKKDIDVIICGHDHIPRVHKYDFGTYLNLGTFHDHKTLVTYNNNQFELVYWNSVEQKLAPFLKK